MIGLNVPIGLRPSHCIRHSVIRDHSESHSVSFGVRDLHLQFGHLSTFIIK